MTLEGKELSMEAQEGSDKTESFKLHKIAGSYMSAIECILMNFSNKFRKEIKCVGSIIYHMTLKYFLHAKSQDYAIYMCYVLHYMMRYLVCTQNK